MVPVLLWYSPKIEDQAYASTTGTEAASVLLSLILELLKKEG